jgi:hypothetical protein
MIYMVQHLLFSDVVEQWALFGSSAMVKGRISIGRTQLCRRTCVPEIGREIVWSRLETGFWGFVGMYNSLSFTYIYK